MNQDPKKIEVRLQALITKLKRHNKISVETVKQWIYESDDEDSMRPVHIYQKKFMQAFSNAKEADMQEVVNVSMHCWNVFPHKALGGLSPQEKHSEHYGKNTPEDIKKEDVDPIMNVGPHKIKMSEYTKMAAEIEKAQRPLKKWLETIMLPKYEHRLKECYSTKTVEKHVITAEIFIQKVLSAGYTNYEDISLQFTSWFCEWWETHVLYSNLTPDQVWKSVAKFLDYIYFTTGKDVRDERNND